MNLFSNRCRRTFGDEIKYNKLMIIKCFSSFFFLYLSSLLFREGILSKLMFIRSSLTLFSNACHLSWFFLKEKERKNFQQQIPNYTYFFPYSYFNYQNPNINATNTTSKSMRRFLHKRPHKTIWSQGPLAIP